MIVVNLDSATFKPCFFPRESQYEKAGACPHHPHITEMLVGPTDPCNVSHNIHEPGALALFYFSCEPHSHKSHPTYPTSNHPLISQSKQRPQ